MCHSHRESSYLKENRKAGTTLSVCLSEVSVERELTVVKSAYKANKLPRAVFKGQGLGISSGYYEHSPRLLS